MSVVAAGRSTVAMAPDMLARLFIREAMELATGNRPDRYPRRIAAAVALTMLGCAAWARDDSGVIEEIVVTGTQIRGANIAEALAVSVVTAEDIDVLGIDSGEELLAMIPENGQNFFNEAENISGGVNSARGDVGAYNLRSMGTGNTLSLLNGRRVVNSATFQTEEVGGSFVPVNTANTNTIPVRGVERVEVLRDGASAIYGADAVAGVVNTVLKSDFEGLTVRVKHTEFDSLPRNDQSFSVEWGRYFNDGRTNVGFFFDYLKRGRVNSQDDERWANSDFREQVPEDSPFAGSASFRNNSANSLYGQFDVVSRLSSSHSLRRNDLTDSSGEFEVFPAGDPLCTFTINDRICGAADGNGTVRHNLNGNRDLNSRLNRYNMFLYVNHEFDTGFESFTEVSAYLSETNMFRHSSTPFSSVKLRVGAENHYNPFGPCGSPNRLPDSVLGDSVPCEGLALTIDNYRFAELPRIVDNDGETWRLLQGFRGQWNEWDWETAASWSRSSKQDVTHNRVSNTLMQAALNDASPSAYNPFSGGVNSNIEQALISVRRDSEAELTTVDFKLFNNNILAMPAGPVGFLAGVEYRRESFKDDRDPRLDGTVQFVDNEGDTFPYVSDVVNSSPTADNSGSRNVWSVLGELQIPVLDSLDLQLALRHENYSDIRNTTVGKVALGWRPFHWLLFRGSYSQAFRAPNLITINEEIVARSNTRNDYACVYAAELGGDPDQDIVDCRNSIQRTAQGSADLEPEESDNYSVGIVFEPLDGLSVTADYWSIEKENTIGLFGEENHTVLDLLMRIENGLNNCPAAAFNPAVLRDAEIDPDAAAVYQAAGICPAGGILRVDDQYANLDDRTVRGVDVGFYYDLDTAIGRFHLKYNASFLLDFEQQPGGDSATLLAAQEAGVIPLSIPVDGFADLVDRDGNQDYRHNTRLSWRHGDFGAAVGWSRIGGFYQSSLTLADGTRWEIPVVDTFDANVDWHTTFAGRKTRVRFGVKNLTDRRAPLADRYFGYFADAHTDLGRYMYLDIRANVF